MCRLWKWFWSPSARVGMGVLLIIGIVLGVIFVTTFSYGVAATNNTEFCISCHTMADTVYVEYQESVHYKNAAGVRAGCPDCHVPKAFWPKMMRKLEAANDVWHEWIGTIDTKEKFYARREVLAERVWARMKGNDSVGCRSCHSYEAMHFEKQSNRAQEKMRKAQDEGKTCIECHTGVAHKLPVTEALYDD